MKTALQLAAASPYVEMFVWFIFRDSDDKTWFSGLQRKTGVTKPAYGAFSAAAKAVDGQSIVVAPNRTFKAKIFMPLFTYYDLPGTPVGVTYSVFQGKGVAASGQPRVMFSADQTVNFTVNFKPAKGATYTMTVVVNDKHGWIQKRIVTLIPAP